MVMCQRKAKASLDITLIPLINVIFLLVIFFLLTGTIRQQEYIPEVQAPDATTGGEIEIAPLTVTLDQDNMVMVDNIPVTLQSLEDDLSLILESKKYKGQPLILQADKRSDAAVLVRIMEIAGNAGAPEVSIVTRGR